MAVIPLGRDDFGGCEECGGERTGDGGFQSWAELWRNSGGESVSVKDERSCG